MSKATKSIAAPAAAEPVVVAPKVTPVTASAPVVQTLSVKPGIVSRGARAAWYALALQYNGKPVAEFLAAGTANPPSLYTARSKHNGNPHSAVGYLRGLVRRGWVTLV
jgi:hypothetical protein